MTTGSLSPSKACWSLPGIAFICFSAEAFLDAGILEDVDCLISDIGMPGMDGFRLLRLIQADRPGLPVFLITGREELNKGQPSPTLPPNHFLVKPFDGKKLLSEVAVALRQTSE